MMLIKFIGNNCECVVETDSYTVQQKNGQEIKSIIVNAIKRDSSAKTECPTEFLLIADDDHYSTAFIMNNLGQTIDRISVV